MIELSPVNSSNVKAVGYFGTSLYVRYSNATYEYENVPQKIYLDLMNAESKGRFLCENVKGKFAYKKLVE